VGIRGDDAQLVAAMAQGSRDALAELYDRYAPHLLAVARRMLGDRSEAEDLLHDVFLEAWRQACGYDAARGTVRAWLLIRLRARTLDRIRLRRLRASTAEVAPIAAPPVAGPDDGSVTRALAGLPAEQRRAIVLAYYQGLSASEIAALDRAPLGTIKSRMTAAMAKLRVALRDDAAAEGGT
jgi:RNA polymerase sigma-70 factor (ECF subfamily)